MMTLDTIAPRPADVADPNDNGKRFQGTHHARFHKAATPYHIISRVFQGRCLLVPTPEINDAILGIVARAQRLWPSIELYAYAFLSNHMHLCLAGDPEHIPSFVGFIKREICRRVGPMIGWRGDSMWGARYLSTALPTPASQIQCMKYILAQGVKERLTEAPEMWPGVHVARKLFGGEAQTGHWLDATAYARALHREKRKLPENRRTIDKDAFADELEVTLALLPAWKDLTDDERAAAAQRLRAEIIAEARVEGAAPVLGTRGILATLRDTILSMPSPPWFEDRRRMIVWADRRSEETRAYVDEYWQFQRAFRAASAAYGSTRAVGHAVPFPLRAFVPGVWSGRVQALVTRAA